MIRLASGRTVVAGLAVPVVVIALVLATVSAQAALGWAVVQNPNPASYENVFRGVACPGAFQCWAVGWQTNLGASPRSLIERWNGRSWSVVDGGNVDNASTTELDQLYGITCTGVSNCWAVGIYSKGGASSTQPLWVHWDGTSWTASTHAVGDGSAQYGLKSVSCVDADNCWAAGDTFDRSKLGVWIEQWNGTTWINDPVTDVGVLYGISCADAKHCWAVGDTGESSGLGIPPFKTLIEAWNGTAWSLQASPNQGDSNNMLRDVSCVSASMCWAAGLYHAQNTGAPPSQNLLEEWNGTSWTVAADLAETDNNSPSATPNELNAITCLSVSSCWAVGDYWNTSVNANQTLVDQFNGSSWSPVPNTPNETIAPSRNNTLLGVGCADVAHCAAVGDVFLPDPTLILMYQPVIDLGHAASLTPSVPATGGAGALPVAVPVIGVGVLAVVGAFTFTQTRLRRRR